MRKSNIDDAGVGASWRYTLRSVTTPLSTSPSRQMVNTDGGWKTMTVSRECSCTPAQGDACCCARARRDTVRVDARVMQSVPIPARALRRIVGDLRAPRYDAPGI